LLKGGLPAGSFVLVIGPPGTGKATFCRNFAQKHLDNNRSCVYLTTHAPVDHLKKLFTIPKAVRMMFVDGYSGRQGAKEAQTDSLLLKTLDDLNEVGLMVRNAIQASWQGESGVLVVDSLSDLIYQNDETQVVKLIHILKGLMTPDTVGILTVEEGLHEPHTMVALEHATDGTIRMKIEGSERLMQISRMRDTQHSLDWIKFEIGATGIILRAMEVI
jgi:KaiC/GvpD/RAD55 family RecA-like ATPase